MLDVSGLLSTALDEELKASVDRLCSENSQLKDEVRQTLALMDNRITSKVVVDSMGIYLTDKERHC